MLLVNNRDRNLEVMLPSSGAEVEVVDQTTGGGAPAKETATGNKMTLRGLAVAIVKLK